MRVDWGTMRIQLGFSWGTLRVLLGDSEGSVWVQ